MILSTFASLGRFLLLMDDLDLNVSLYSVGFVESFVCLFGEISFEENPTGIVCFMEDVDAEAKVTTLSHTAITDFFDELRGMGSVSIVDFDVEAIVFCDFSGVINERNALRHSSKRFRDKVLFFFSDALDDEVLQ